MHFVEKVINRVTVLTVKGNLVAKEETDKFQLRIEQILEKGSKNIVVDLKHISMISSLGIGGLITGLRKVREEKGDLRLCGLSDRIKRVLDITKLIGVIQVYDNWDEGVKSFSV